MAIFDSEEILKGIRLMMQATGSWPAQNLTGKYTVVRYSWMILVSSFSVTATMKALGDLSFGNVSFGLSCVAVATSCVLKYAILFYSKPSFFRILRMLKHPLLASHEDFVDVHLQKKIRICNSLRGAYLSLLGATFVMTVLSPVPYVKSERTVPVPFPLDFQHQSTIIYVLVWALQAIAAGIIGWQVMCFDSLIFTFMELGAAQLKMLEVRIISSMDNILSTSQVLYTRTEETYDVKLDKLLRKCIMQHVVIERYINSVEEAFTWTFLMQMIASLIIICLVGFTCVLTPIASLQFAKNFFLLSAIVIQLVIFCVPGNEIIDQSEKIGHACYMAQWHKCRPSVRKTLLLMMTRSRTPFVLTAAKFLTLSHETLLAILNTAFSYFTVLWQLYAKANKL